MKYCLLPYQLIAEFAWDWLAVHYWTSRFIIVNTMLLSGLDGFFLWRTIANIRCAQREKAAYFLSHNSCSYIIVTHQDSNLTLFCRTMPQKMWTHLCKMLFQGFAFALLWPFVPQFVCNCLFNWALYISPIINFDLVLQQLLHFET